MRVLKRKEGGKETKWFLNYEKHHGFLASVAELTTFLIVLHSIRTASLWSDLKDLLC